MALVADICVATYESDCSAQYVEDKTGDYDPDTNTGGYGSPNVAFSSLYFILTAVAKRLDYQTGILYDIPLSVSRVSVAGKDYFKVITSGDGFYVYTFKSILKKGSPEEDTDKALWDETILSLVRFNGTDFTPITEADLVETDYISYVEEHRYFFTCNSDKCIAKKFSELPQGCGCESKKFKNALYDIAELEINYQNAINDFDAKLFTRAQRHIDKVTKACSGKCGKGGSGCGCK